MEPVKVAAVQAAPVLLDRDATVAKVVALCEKAAAEGAGCVLEHPGVGGRIWLGGPRVVVPAPAHPAAGTRLPAGLASCTGLYVAVRGIGGTGARAHVHIADSVAGGAPDAAVDRFA